jgi:ABC-type nitrate/sulfonate/bicarbonate transport system substrate-binding protein
MAAFDQTRRNLLAGAGTFTIAGALSGTRWFGVAQAQGATPLSFQLSWLKSIQYGGYFAAVENGIYKKHGIEPTFNSGGPNVDPIANVASGQSGLGDRPIGPIIVAREKGIPIKVIGTVFQKSPYSIMSLAKKPIRTLKDLEGKTIMVATSGRPLMINLIREAGLDPRSVNIVPSAPDPSALISGQIDAYTGYSTNQGVVLKLKGVDLHIIHVHDLGMPETAGTIYGREDFLKANRDLVVRFLRASREGWDWALANQEATAKLMVEKYGVPGLDYKAQLVELQESKPFIAGEYAAKKGLLALDVSLFEKIIGLYRSAGMVKSDMKASDLCDPSYVEAASQA